MDDLLFGPLGPERARPPADLIRAALTALAATALIAGCGGSADEAGDQSSDGLGLAGGAGQLTWAVPDLPRSIDPLAASTPSARLISRQVHEPLIGGQRPPYGRGGVARLLAIKVSSGPDGSIWSVRLRSGIRFVDGSPLNAGVVLVNARRWMSTPAGQRLLPGLVAVDAPTPSEVRFVLAAPDARFNVRLGSPMLGLVSPAALEPRSGEDATMVSGATGTGTGPFEFAGLGDDSVELARNAEWWGTPLLFGPALDGVAFHRVPSQTARAGALARGEVQVAPLGTAQRERALRANPLIEEIAEGLVAEGSVRGIGPGYPSLAGAWLTSLGS